MNDSEKLDLILEKLLALERKVDEQQLHDLAKKHWGLTSENIHLIELTKQILDRGESNEGKVLQFLFTINELVDRVGAERMIEYLNKAQS